jgi:hypothetical protein
VIERELVEEAQRDPGERERDRHRVDAGDALAQDPGREQRHPDRRRILDQDRVRGRGELVGEDEQARGRRERGRGDPLRENDPAQRRAADRKEHCRRDHGAHRPDRAGRPRHEHDQRARGTPEQSAQREQRERAAVGAGVVDGGRHARRAYSKKWNDRPSARHSSS